MPDADAIIRQWERRYPDRRPPDLSVFEGLVVGREADPDDLLIYEAKRSPEHRQTSQSQRTYGGQYLRRLKRLAQRDKHRPPNLDP